MQQLIFEIFGKSQNLVAAVISTRKMNVLFFDVFFS